MVSKIQIYTRFIQAKIKQYNTNNALFRDNPINQYCIFIINQTIRLHIIPRNTFNQHINWS